MQDLPEPIKKLRQHKGDFPAFILDAENCTVYFSELKAGTEIPPHSHDTDNHGIISGGKLFLEVEGEEKIYSTGDWYHVPANAVHSARTEIDTTLIEFWFNTSHK